MQTGESREHRRAQAARASQRGGRPPEAERESRRSARYQELLAAAEAAVGRIGPDVTMTEMAAQAGVTKPVLYRYFGDRAGLYEALAARYADGLLNELRVVLGRGPAGRRTLELGVDTYLRYIEANAHLYRFLAARLPAADPDGHKLVAGFLERMANDVSGVLGESLLAAGIETRGARLLGYGVTGAVQLGGEAWLHDADTIPRAEAVRYLADLVWYGLVGVATHPGTGAGPAAHRRSATDKKGVEG